MAERRKTQKECWRHVTFLSEGCCLCLYITENSQIISPVFWTQTLHYLWVFYSRLYFLTFSNPLSRGSLLCSHLSLTTAITVKFSKKTTTKLVLINSCYPEAGTSCYFHLVFRFSQPTSSRQIASFSRSTAQHFTHSWDNKVLHWLGPLSCREQQPQEHRWVHLAPALKCSPRGCNSSFSKKKTNLCLSHHALPSSHVSPHHYLWSS